MNEQRLQAYLTLIQALLDSPNEAANILNQNLELLDADFLNELAGVAQQLEAEGKFLKTWGAEIATALGLVEEGEEVQREEQTEGALGEVETAEALRVLQWVWSEIAGGYNIPKIHRILQENLAVVNNWQIYPQLFARLMIGTLEKEEVDTSKMLAALLVEFGNIIQQFPLGNRLGNLEIGIAAYETALQVRTREAFPQDWAATQNNLANAYRNRIRGEKADNLEQAIAGYENALQVRTREAFPQDWAMTQNNLALAYSDRIRGEKADNLEQAIAGYENALQVRTREAFPQDWAMTQNNLALAYSDRIRGEKADNLEQAIAGYEKALQVLTRDAFPQDWAMTQNNLALAYSDRIRGEKADNLEKAISGYKSALTVSTRDAFPQEFANTSFNLGHAYQKATQWQNAYDTFSAAINTVESMREEILSGDESKQKLAEQWNKLYINIVETCLQLNLPTEALEYAERSKTRNLVEQILLRDSHTIFPPNVADELAQLRDDIASAQYQIQKGKVENYPELEQRLQQLRQRRNQLQDKYLPVGSSFRFDSFQHTLDSHTAIIEWYITSETFLAFIITSPSPDTKRVETLPPLASQERGLGGEVSVWKSTPEDFTKLIDWTNTYLETYYTESDTWRNQLTDKLQTLAQILHLDELLQHLPQTCNRLILIPHWFLHLFPIHALPVRPDTATRFLEGRLPIAPTVECAETEPHYLLDIFPNGVSYAPSCQLLQQVQTRKDRKFDTLFAIQTPTSDLYGSDLGAVEAIQQQFADSYILKQEKATKSTLLLKDEATQTLTQSDKLQTAHSLFFFCHGYFNPNSPLDSGLQLADDTLTLAEIIAHFRLDNCRLVTLSACETGLVDFSNNSDEYIGLPNGFLIAGSRAVFSSLWTVQSLSTALLVVRFYQNLKSGLSLAVALQEAQSWLRNATKSDLEIWSKRLPNANHRKQLRMFLREEELDKPFASPYYWAAFCAVGE
jgi:CHAT domain-containing protein